MRLLMKKTTQLTKIKLNLLELNSKYCNITAHKVDIQKGDAFLYTRNA